MLIRLTVAAVAVVVPLLATAQSKPKQAPQAPATVQSAAGTIRVERLATLEYPWGLAALPDGRLLITEKPGRLRLWADGKLSEPLTGLPKTSYKGDGEQGGLMDVAIDPDFAKNRRVYLSFTEAAEPQPPDARNEPEPRFRNNDPTDTLVRGGAVARAVLDGDRLTDVRVIWRQVPKTVGRGHFGNRLAFGPDKRLYVTSGDRMRFDPAQRLDTNLGKVVRIATDGSIPKDNPFAQRKGARGDIYSLGHRNAIAAAFEPASGRLWAFEMGPLGGDEANLVTGGQNYGWPVVSDGDNYDRSTIPNHADRPSFAEPAKTWTPVISPSGAIFYDGAMFAGWRGDALVGSLSAQGIVRLKMDGAKIVDEERIRFERRVRDIEQGADGALWVITDDDEGELLRLTPDRQAAR